MIKVTPSMPEISLKMLIFLDDLVLKGSKVVSATQ
jgi:hypothetical protein